MTVSALREQLNWIAQELRGHIDNINYGGCCVAAVAMYEKLKPICGRKLRIEFQMVSWGDEESMAEKLRGWKNSDKVNHNADVMNHWTDASCHHAYVVFEYGGSEWYFDTDKGMIPYHKQQLIGRDLYTLVRMPYRVAKRLANSSRGWNDWFNRDNIGVLRDIVKVSYLQVA